MIRTAVIMAGGRGERMARSGVTDPKPLVTVHGTTLLEWNLRLLICAGVERILVSVAADDRLVRDAVATRLRTVGEGVHVDVDELVEETPLGNIGSIGLLLGTIDPVVVVYADNLTGIDLGAICADHLAGDADLTLAAHREPFVMPFGELTTCAADPGRLVRYTEKPTYLPLVSSAVIVAGPHAIERAAGEAPIGISQLSQSLIDEGGVVRVFVHDAPWVDVNDRAAIDRAEQLVVRHPEIVARTLPRDARDPVGSGPEATS